MVIDMENKKINGKVTISDRAIMQIAINCAVKCPEVARMSEKSKKNEVAKTISGYSDATGGYVFKTKTGIRLDVYVACKYGADTNKLKTELEKSIINAYHDTGVLVTQADIHINSVA